MNFFPDTKLISALPFRVFGCVVYVYIPSHSRTKLDRKTLKCIFLGYSNTQKGFKCYYPVTKKMFVSFDVVFDENNAYYSSFADKNITRTDEFWSILDVVSDVRNIQDTHSLESKTSEAENEPIPRLERPIAHVYTRRNKAPSDLKLPLSSPANSPSESESYSTVPNCK